MTETEFQYAKWLSGREPSNELRLAFLEQRVNELEEWVEGVQKPILVLQHLAPDFAPNVFEHGNMTAQKLSDGRYVIRRGNQIVDDRSFNFWGALCYISGWRS